MIFFVFFVFSAHVCVAGENAQMKVWVTIAEGFVGTLIYQLWGGGGVGVKIAKMKGRSIKEGGW